jgi:para-nitrobenzyl esterase
MAVCSLLRGARGTAIDAASDQQGVGMSDKATTVPGDVRGVDDGGVVRFAGIPFAAPVVGDRRFRPPEPPESWQGVRDASTAGPTAPQHDMMAQAFGSEPQPTEEDCLFLNVFTPQVDDARRPVMVWIHGGAFFLGSGSEPSYDGAKLAARGDVVVVTINYRLGALGFLHLAGIDSSFDQSGNQGLLDQVAALRWVRDNIAGFGGDPENVTIFGESAGGMSVGSLLALPAARGLFHKAIPQSGAADNISPVGHAVEVAERFLAAAGADDVAGLARLSADEIVNVQQQFVIEFFTDVDGHAGAGAGAHLPFQPVVDGVAFTEPASDGLAVGVASHIPVLTGTCLDEWNLFQFLDATELDEEALVTRFDKLLGDGSAAVEVYRSAHPDKDPKQLFGAAVTDVVFRQPAIRLAEAQVRNGAPTFMYLFTWPSPAVNGLFGACHALEVPFVFGNLDAPGLSMLVGDSPPPTLVDTIQESWLAFARTGDPSNDLVGDWPAYDLDRRATVALDESVDVVDDPESTRRGLWEGVL